MEKDKVTIIVPIYNTKEVYFNECISSLLNQTYRNLEIILIDDGSTNGIGEVLDTYQKEDARIRVFHTSNHGVSHARNVGLKHATGDYIFFVDGDDWIDLQCIQEVMAYANDDMVFWTYVKEYGNHSVVYKQHIEKEINIYDLTFLGSTVKALYKKSIIKGQLFDESLTNGEDVEFNYRVFENVHQFHYLPHPYYHYRILPSSAVRKNSEQTINNYQKTLHAMENQMHTRPQQEAYYSFMAIAFLMICMHVYLKNGEGIKAISNLSKRAPFNTLKSHLSLVKLPTTRKLPIICLKYHFYLGTYIICKLKIKMDQA